MKYYYFISYVFQHGLNVGYGNITFTRNSKIRTYEDLDPIIKNIQDTDSNIGKVTIMNIDLLDEEII